MRLITFGEVMMRLSPPGVQRFAQAEALEITYGGGEANVAVALSNLGYQTSHVTCFPDNDLGYAAAGVLQKWGVGVENIVFEGKRIGIYYLEKGSSVRASKVVYDRDTTAFAEMSAGLFNWKEILKGATWFHWTGITPAISQAAADSCLEAIKIASELGVTVSGDITFRKNLWQYGKSAQELMPQLLEGCNIINCGESEAEEIFGIEAKGDRNAAFENAASSLMHRFPKLKKVIATKRETKNASHNYLGGLLWNGTNLLESKGYDIVPIVDRIGGGDAFMAGFIYASMKGGDDKETINFATAASALKHSIPGDALLATENEIKQLVIGESVGRLVR